MTTQNTTDTFGVEMQINGQICFYINAGSAEDAKAKASAIIDSNPLFQHFYNPSDSKDVGHYGHPENYSFEVIDPELTGYYFTEEYTEYTDEPLPFVVG